MVHQDKINSLEASKNLNKILRKPKLLLGFYSTIKIIIKFRMKTIIITIEKKFQEGESCKFAKVSENQMLSFMRFRTIRTI